MLGLWRTKKTVSVYRGCIRTAKTNTWEIAYLYSAPSRTFAIVANRSVWLLFPTKVMLITIIVISKSVQDIICVGSYYYYAELSSSVLIPSYEYFSFHLCHETKTFDTLGSVLFNSIDWRAGIISSFSFLAKLTHGQSNFCSCAQEE